MTAVDSQEELIALVREKGPEFDEKDLADIGHVNRDDVLATMADGATLGASAAMVLSSPAGWMGVALIGVGIGGGLLGTYWARSVGAGETVAGLLELAGMRRVGQVPAEGPYPAAVGHQVAHSYALLGFLASVAIGVVAACAVGALFATGVGGLVLLGAAAGYGVLAGFYGTAISDALSSLGSRAGPIKNGSTDVFIGGKGAARWVDEVECSKDPPMQIIVEGSETIFVNNLPLARVGHKLLCGAVIDEGDSSIIVDRTTRRCAIPKSEVPLWARVAVDLAILASLYKGAKWAAKNRERNTLLKEMSEAGTKHTPSDIVAVERINGKIVFLEKGSGKAGLQHIVDVHGDQFAMRGVAAADLPEYLLTALREGTPVGMQGSRPVYEFAFRGVTQRVAITVSNNGYIVGANPAK